MPELGQRPSLQMAFSLHQAGQLKSAAKIYRRILQTDPNNFFALHYLGIVEANAGNFAKAKPLLARSLQLQPANMQFIENYAAVLCQAADYQAALEVCEHGLRVDATNVALRYAGATALLKLKRPQEAVAWFDRVLLLQPNHVAALNERGSALAATKEYDAALASVEKALKLQPQYAEAHLNSGNLYAWLQRGDEAITAYDRALACKPDLADAWVGRGNVLLHGRQYEEALAAYDKALAQSPVLASAWLGRGNVLFEMKRHEEAQAAFDKALALDPDLAEAWIGVGNLRYELGRTDDAAADFDKALALKPDLPEAWLGRGNVLKGRGRHSEALAAYDRAIALKPELAEAWLGRGTVFLKINRPNDALAAIDRALGLDRDFVEALACRGYALFELNSVSEAFAELDRALVLKPDFPQVISDRIFILDYASNVGFAEQQDARKYWWQAVGAPIAERSHFRHSNTRDPDRRIRVGYVSAEFRRNSAALCFRPMLRNHNKAEFEITCYSASLEQDDLTAEFRQIADRWRDVAQSSDEEFCNMIQADQIDILVDLTGHIAGHRLGVFARKPAPVQVSAGATGTGLPTIDYLFSDPVTCPPEVRHLFAERIFDLPCPMTIEPPPDQARPSSAPVLTAGNVTFGVFNRANKISDGALAVWAGILNSLPRSRILMKHYAFDEEPTRLQMLERFAMHGVSADRVAFLGRTSRDEHLVAFKDVDISLDTFPQNGGISTLESLQMGVPVVALLGNGISGRIAGAILTALGMADWMAQRADEYAAIAVKFASMPEHVAALRRELPGRVLASPLGNGAQYTKAIETAYRTMWTDYCRATEGLPGEPA